MPNALTEGDQSLRTINIPDKAQKREAAQKKLETAISNHEWMCISSKEYRMNEKDTWRTIAAAKPNFLSCNNGVMTFSDANGTIWLGLVMGDSTEEMEIMFGDIGIRQYDADNNLTNPFSADIASVEFRDREEQAHFEYIRSLQDTNRKRRKLLAMRPKEVSLPGINNQTGDIVAAAELAERIKKGT